MNQLRWAMGFVLMLILGPQLPATTTASCTVTESQLLGDWIGGVPFEEMAFEKDSEGNHFSSWLHHRPEHFDWRWTLAECQLRIIDNRNTNDEYRFYVKRISRTRLTLVDLEDGNVGRYRRIP